MDCFALGPQRHVPSVGKFAVSCGSRDGISRAGLRDGDEWELAAHHFPQALSFDRGMAQAHFNLALAYARLGKHQDTTKAFRHAVELALRNSQIAVASILKDYLDR